MRQSLGRFRRSRLRTLVLGVAIAACALGALEASRRADRRRLLSPRAGPYLILVHRSRGADAGPEARALVSELRRDHDLRAYYFEYRPGDAGGRRTTGAGVSGAEYAVFVGSPSDTIDAGPSLLPSVKRIAPEALAGEGGKPATLRRALLTTNPLSPPEDVPRTANP